MSDIVKASRAAAVVYSLLREDKKQYAIWLMEMTYQCNRVQATDFVEIIEDIYNVGN
ncbi:unnamed protein product [marine sediment metagenome]|uniref:Uncharacterized protein n=1 Tax=marine sediment metagenome TaxID=412755 RepID=X0YU25_9ZZZZ